MGARTTTPMTDRIRACLSGGLAPADVAYYYQPLYHVQSGNIDKAEMLLRVRDGGAGFFNTETLVAAAEELELIDEMDRQGFIHACHVLPQFQAAGVTELSVNLSPAACHSPRLISEVRRILAETGTAPGHICIELTEAESLLSEADFFGRLQSLHDVGVKIAMDDFGKGFSNIQRMINIPFDIVKLDKSLVWSLEQRGLAVPLLRNIIEVAHEHSITVVAEGVETAEQAARLSDMGCDYLQGFYFSPPVPMEQFFGLLRLKSK